MSDDESQGEGERSGEHATNSSQNAMTRPEPGTFDPQAFGRSDAAILSVLRWTWTWTL
jgi:hypothetical protein